MLNNKRLVCVLNDRPDTTGEKMWVEVLLLSQEDEGMHKEFGFY